MAGQLDISRCTLHRILKDRSSIEQASLENGCVTRKRKQILKEEIVEVALNEWFLKIREKDARLDNPLFHEKAEQMVKTLGQPDFKVTEGWFQCWKK